MDGHKGRSIHCVDAHHLEGLCIGGIGGVCTSCRDESHLQCQANVVSPGGIGGVLKVRRAPALVTSVCNALPPIPRVSTFIGRNFPLHPVALHPLLKSRAVACL